MSVGWIGFKYDFLDFGGKDSGTAFGTFEVDDGFGGPWIESVAFGMWARDGITTVSELVLVPF